ncbi:MAG: PhzF family phenazine biosynthesis protein [Pseudomonadota bacterium]
MTTYPIDWVDAFAGAPFGGNPCAVIHDADGLSPEVRMALVRETRLSECAYIVRSDKADFGARYYLAGAEIPMAGHPTVATVASLLDRGVVALEDGHAAFTLEVGAGVMAIEVEADAHGPLIAMTQAAPVFGAEYDPGEIAALYGLDATDIAHPPQDVSTGNPFCIAVLTGHDALARAVLDSERLFDWRTRHGHSESMEPFLVTLEGATAAGTTFSRLLLPPPNPPEDPFTGSATGCMAAYLWARGLIETPRLTAEQGHWMGRPGAAEVEVLGPQDAITGVRVGGRAAILMRGTLEV